MFWFHFVLNNISLYFDTSKAIYWYCIVATLPGIYDWKSFQQTTSQMFTYLMLYAYLVLIGREEHSTMNWWMASYPGTVLLASSMIVIGVRQPCVRQPLKLCNAPCKIQINIYNLNTFKNFSAKCTHCVFMNAHGNNYKREILEQKSREMGTVKKWRSKGGCLYLQMYNS